MNSDHRVKALVGKISRAMGSDLAQYVFEDSRLTLYFRFPLEARDREPLKLMIKEHLPKCRVRLDTKKGIITATLP